MIIFLSIQEFSVWAHWAASQNLRLTALGLLRKAKPWPTPGYMILKIFKMKRKCLADAMDQPTQEEPRPQANGDGAQHKISTITGLPHFATQSEHDQLTATTPGSFDLLPPLLRCKVENTTILFSGLVDSGPLNGWSETKCDLLITEKELALHSINRDQSLIIPHQLISLHGISRPQEGQQQSPSIYCQLDLDAHQDEDETEESTELNIVPEDSSTLNQIFEALSYCASLHPLAAPQESGQNDLFF
ncbi:hypothetical protein O181_003932 [Austropuccinia psidii MF-1]|uniref:Uncharacterized protein n=1 Tax=Austropuccinia psidii MF-1 TaxID=1389203 RepID=A0A9Q3GFB3_9BASI|nr:hypothetical protein [Austropuccinia psidii MF-1]